MSHPDGFWTFVDPCGCPYGSLAPIPGVTTPMQAWADFYDGMAPERRKAERRGCTVRPAQPGDLDRLQAFCPHRSAS